jgi:hypothetical protein
LDRGSFFEDCLSPCFLEGSLFDKLTGNHFPGLEIVSSGPGNLLMVLFLLYTVTVLLCWFLTGRMLFAILLAVIVNIAVYCLVSLF